MINIIINEKLKSFEADIRDLCMAFFPYETFYYNEKNTNDINQYDYIIDNYYNDIIYNNRFETKNNLKRSLYYYLSKLTNKNLKWGILTGIRPVNIVNQIYEYLLYKEWENSELVLNFIQFCRNKNINIKNNFDAIIFNYLKNEYLVSDEKINQLIDISKQELKIINKKNIKDYKSKCSVYISVPFCKSTCLYCSFTSFNINQYSKYIDNYLLALENQLIDFVKNNKEKILTIYVGGGTPTSLDDIHFNKFLSIINKYLYSNNVIEYTIEAGRPDTINEFKLKLMKKFKVTRISINPQTFNQKTLDLIGRKHTANDILKIYNLAKKYKFDNINMDIILGLPNEKLDDLVNTLIQIGRLKPESITVHLLALKRASRLNYEKNIWIDTYLAGNAHDNCIEYMFECSKYLTKLLNMKPYYLYRQKNIAGNLENIGYTINNKQCIYNIMMMSERHTVYGFGCGAVGKKVTYNNGQKLVERIEGTKSIIDYINKYI